MTPPKAKFMSAFYIVRPVLKIRQRATIIGPSTAANIAAAIAPAAAAAGHDTRKTPARLAKSGTQPQTMAAPPTAVHSNEVLGPVTAGSAMADPATKHPSSAGIFRRLNTAQM